MKKILLILFLISAITLTAFGLIGTYTTNGYFYMPGYGEYGTDAFDEYEAYMQTADTQIESNKTEARTNKWDATSAPGVTNDTDEGYIAGSTWVDVTNDKAYVCLDNTDGAAAWTETTQAGGGSGTVTTSGTPVANDIARFTGATVIEGRSYAELKADLDLEIGTDVEAHDDGLLSIAGLTTAANKSIYTTALDTYAVYDLTAFARTILDDADASAVRTTLGLVYGTNVQAYDDGLLSLAGLTYASDSFIKVTALDTYAIRTIAETQSDLSIYTNLTSFVNQTAWRVFYSNTDGDIIELALGADGTYLESNGAAAAPTFTTPAGAGDVTGPATNTDNTVPRWNGADSKVLQDSTVSISDDGELDMNAGSIGFTLHTATGDGATLVNWQAGNKHKFTFGAQNETITFTNPTNPSTVQMIIVQDATGSRTITWSGMTIKWHGGTAPTLTTTANGEDIVSFIWDGTSYYGMASLVFATP